MIKYGVYCLINKNNCGVIFNLKKKIFVLILCILLKYFYISIYFYNLNGEELFIVVFLGLFDWFFLLFSEN